jgi:hypothetical protein
MTVIPSGKGALFCLCLPVFSLLSFAQTDNETTTNVAATRLPETPSGSATIHADLEIQFAGQTAQYKQVAFQLMAQGKQIKISGTIPATLSDFKIDPPTLLAVAVKNEMPVKVEMTWRPQ